MTAELRVDDPQVRVRLPARGHEREEAVVLGGGGLELPLLLQGHGARDDRRRVGRRRGRPLSGAGAAA